MKELINKSLAELAEGIQNKSWTSVETCQAFLDQTNEQNLEINAIVTLNENLLEQARVCDQVLVKNKDVSSKPLLGVPIGIKDMLCTKDIRTTACSKMLSNFIPPYSATVVTKLQSVGALIFGKCNHDEFAMGSSNEVSYFNPCLNPWNKEYVPGGSSGGSAAAVASKMVPASIGTDTGGSIRQPASFCGVVGVKPTYGRVSRYGIVAFASSFDQAGPLARNVKDASLILEAICGSDKNDSTTSQKPVPSFSKQLSPQVKGLRVGFIKEYLSQDVSDEVREATEKSIGILKSLGAEIKEVSLDYLNLAVPVYYIIATSEASSNLSRYDGVRFGHRAEFKTNPVKNIKDFYSRSRGEGFGEEVKRRIIMGTYALSSGYYDAYYKKACQVRRLIRNTFFKAFDSCDVLLSPVTSSPAFKVGEKISEPLEMYMNDLFTVSANLSGIPAMSLPVGWNQKGLPLGVQISANQFEEQKMLDVACALESALNLDDRINDVL